MRLLLALIAVTVLLSPPEVVAGAQDLRLDGDFVQGALVHGTTDPRARVLLDGRRVRVSPAGRFVIGFGRDAPEQARLEVALPDGRHLERPLHITQRSYQIQRIDGLPAKMVTPPEEVLARIRADAALIAEARAADRAETYFEDGFVWPATGIVTGVFGSQRILNGEPRRPHFGIDIAAPEGTPVKAAAGGVVTVAHADMYFTGGTVVLDHGHGLTSAYLHLKDVRVTEGQVVQQGETIGTVGSTGRSTGAHLDWRLNWFDQRLDPALLVPPMPAPGAN